MAANESSVSGDALVGLDNPTGELDIDDKRISLAERVAARREELLAEKRQHLAHLLDQHDDAVCDLEVCPECVPN